MSRDEEQIRQSLKRALDSFHAPDEMPARTRRRARNRRIAAIGGSATAIALAVALAAWAVVASDWTSPPPVAPAGKDELVRLSTQPPGFIEIEADAGQACYRFEIRGATSAHLHREGSKETFVDLPVNEGGNLSFLGCSAGLDPERLRQIALHPDQFVVEFHNSLSGGAQTATIAADRGEPDCLVTRITSPEYELHFATHQGRPGDEVRVWGPTLRTEGGRYTPSDRLELWWNAESASEGPPQRPGPVIRLATVQTEGRCYFLTSFQVPDVPDGTYDITGFIWHDPDSDSHGIFPGIAFSVRSGETSEAGEYPLLAEAEGMHVFGPSEQPWGLCPTNARPLSREDLPDAERAVLIAMPELHRNLNTKDAYATSDLAVGHQGPPDFPRMIRRNCDASFVQATALVTDHLPHVDSASMRATTYFVSKEPRGWVIWGAW